MRGHSATSSVFCLQGFADRSLGERQERRPIIVTTNLPFCEWTTMIPDPRLCRAIVDRLTHRAHIIDTGTRSIRLGESLARQKARAKREQVHDG